MRKLMILLAVILLAGCMTDYKMKPPAETIMDQHIPGSVFDKTEQGFFTAELVLKPRQPVVGAGRGHLIVHNYEAVDTPGLDISAKLYMPSTGVESSRQPVVKGVRHGLYKVDNLYYDVPGEWVLRLEIKGYRVSDNVVLKLPEVKNASDVTPVKEVPVFGLQ